MYSDFTKWASRFRKKLILGHKFSDLFTLHSQIIQYNVKKKIIKKIFEKKKETEMEATTTSWKDLQGFWF